MRHPAAIPIGMDAAAAALAAALCEDPAPSTHVARTLGTPVPIAQEDVDALHDRYQDADGQR